MFINGAQPLAPVTFLYQDKKVTKEKSMLQKYCHFDFGLC